MKRNERIVISRVIIILFMFAMTLSNFQDLVYAASSASTLSSDTGYRLQTGDAATAGTSKIDESIISSDGKMTSSAWSGTNGKTNKSTSSRIQSAVIKEVENVSTTSSAIGTSDATISSYETELIANGDFESDPSVYGTWHAMHDSNYQLPVFTWDSQIFYGSYGYSIKIQGNHTDGYLYNEISVQPNTEYCFSAMGKGNNVADDIGSLGSYIYIVQIDANRAIINGTGHMFTNKGTFDWSLAKTDFVTASNTASVIIMSGLEGTGTVWYDNESLIRVNPVVGIQLNKTSTALSIGQTMQLTATISPYYATFPQVDWVTQYQSSSNVATVSDTGVVTALKPGTAVIRAISDSNPAIFVDCYITVLSTQDIALPANAVIVDTIMDPVKSVIYMADSTNKKVYSVNYMTGDTKSITFDYPVEQLAIHGNELYVNEVISGNQYSSNNAFKGKIAIIDTNAFKWIDSIDTDFDSFGVAVDCNGNVYVMSGLNLECYSRTTKQLISQIATYMGGFFQMNPSGTKLYAVTAGVSPADFYAYPFTKGILFGGYDSPYHGDYNFNTAFGISPDDKYIYSGSGEVYYCSDQKALTWDGTDDNPHTDLTHAFSLSLPNGNFNAIAFDPGRNQFFTGDRFGITSFDNTNFTAKGYAAVSGEVVGLFNTASSVVAVENKPNESNTTNVYYIEKIDKSSFGEMPNLTLTSSSFIPQFTTQAAAGATNVETGTTVNAVFSNNANASSWFKFTPKVSGTYAIKCPPNGWGMTLYNNLGFDLSYRWRGGTMNVSLEANKLYYLRIGDYYSGGSFSFSIMPTEPKSKVGLNKYYSVINIGQTDQLTATVLPDSLSNKNVIWSVNTSNGNNNVEINSSGLVKAYSIGATVVRATLASDQSIYAECNVIVTNINVPGDLNGDLTVNSADAAIMKDYLLGKPQNDQTNISTNGDLDGDGKITSKDYAMLVRKISR